MRKLQKILLGTFLGGVLLGGIGAGVAFVEYASITYAGEKKIGQESMVTKNLDFSFDPGKGIVNVVPVWYDDGQVSYIEKDETVPEGVIRYQVTYNEKIVTPHLHFSEYDETDEEYGWTEDEFEPDREDDLTDGEGRQGGPGVSEPEDAEAETDTEGTEAGEESEDAESSDGRSRVIVAKPQKKKTVRYQGELYLRSSYRDDFGLWMENKDEILKDLKQGRIASYQADDITDVKILVNPASADFIKEIKEY